MKLSLDRRKLPLNCSVIAVLRFLTSLRATGTIHTNYNLQDPGSWTNGIRNLFARGFDLSKLAEAVGGLPEIREDILRRANRQLDEVFSVSWSQSTLTVHLNVQGGTLEIFVASDMGGCTVGRSGVMDCVLTWH